MRLFGYQNRNTVFFEKAAEGGYVVTVPVLPGCITQGDTFEEAESMIKDAIKCYCESLVKHGEAIPEESGEFVGKVSVPVMIEMGVRNVFGKR